MKIKDRLRRDDDLMIEGISSVLMAILISNKFIEVDMDMDIKDHNLYSAVCRMVGSWLNTEIPDMEKEELDKMFPETSNIDKEPEVLTFDNTLVGQQQKLLHIMKDFDSWLSTMASRYKEDKDDMQLLIKDVLK